MVTHEEEQKLEELVKSAGKRLLQYWPGDAAGQDLKIKTKADGTFVTKADFESNEILVTGLKQIFPTHEIYSEEMTAGEQVRLAEQAWIIDPLDGTKSFIDGRDDFSILLGLSSRSAIDYGVMYFPVRGLFGRAGRGLGAYLNGLALSVSDAENFRTHKVYLRHIEISDASYVYPKWMDSGMAFLNLCRGELDGIIIKLVHHQEWDLAAPTVMIEESGGMVTNEHGDPVKFERAPVRDRYFIASNGKVHQQLLDLIRQLPV